jgi:hypothetical protein
MRRADLLVCLTTGMVVVSRRNHARITEGAIR